ncbi:major facilitator superfamily transporter dha1 transporter [Niveomyces insectorum RCEF 264]|uniref:Major facilitator superfamily transporter dha1 transporter n=1 Tax=Niveomyces insectorum RCEF 264 TaxID=1081102 RepID=A0A167XXQ6_9HYPO|nr:major facilitator superfamily transporter dha1 transporter [Niveomyces insectorum RCEF 264]
MADRQDGGGPRRVRADAESQKVGGVEQQVSADLEDGETERNGRAEEARSNEAPEIVVVADATTEKTTALLSPLRRLWAGLCWALLWTPRTCRYDPNSPPDFTFGLNLLFSFATTATVGNLYYNQPILYKMADTFGVSYEHASNIATLMQAGYAVGIVLLCPPADMLPRRPYILALVAVTALTWIGLCVTPSFVTFAALSFVCGLTTVTPQLMLPLVGDLAPPHRRASSCPACPSACCLGAQGAVFFSLYFFMPDYPTKNRWRAMGGGSDGDGDGGGVVAPPGGPLRVALRYARVLYGGIAMLLVQQPTLTQACVVVFCMSAVFTSYWTTLSFLLASPPYNYSSVAIGLFALIGIVVICMAPLYGRFVIDKTVPIIAVLFSLLVEIAGVGVGVGIGTFTVAGPILQAILIDFGNQASNIALRASIYGLAPKAQNRVNAAFMISSFLGQLTGTAAGNHLYAMGGWRYSGALSIALLGFAIAVCIARGPREMGWFGWHGGWAIRRDRIVNDPRIIPSELPGEEGVLEPGSSQDDANTTGEEKR